MLKNIREHTNAEEKKSKPLPELVMMRVQYKCDYVFALYWCWCMCVCARVCDGGHTNLVHLCISAVCRLCLE